MAPRVHAEQRRSPTATRPSWSRSSRPSRTWPRLLSTPPGPTAYYEALRPRATGVYSNFLEAEGEDRIHEAYPEATYRRLADIKRRYDPSNLFRLNQNIAPATAR